jgi:hypothetical protein
VNDNPLIFVKSFSTSIVGKFAVYQPNWFNPVYVYCWDGIGFKNTQINIKIFIKCKTKVIYSVSSTLTLTPIFKEMHIILKIITTINNIFQNTGNGLEYLLFNINATTSKSFFYVNNEIYSNTSSSYSPNFYYVLDFSPNFAVQCQTNNYSTLGAYLGFNKLKYTINSSYTYTDIITQVPPIQYEGYISSYSSVGVNIDNYIFVHIDDFNKNHNSNGIVSQTAESLNSHSIMGRISLPSFSDTVVVNNISNSNGVFKKRDYYGQVRIRQLEVSLLNKYGQPLEIFNNNYSLALEFETLYNP